jgi:predicted small lipoprotein YifL
MVSFIAYSVSVHRPFNLLMRRFKPLLFVLITGSLLIGCGQKGPLFLPDAVPAPTADPVEDEDPENGEKEDKGLDTHH